MAYKSDLNIPEGVVGLQFIGNYGPYILESLIPDVDKQRLTLQGPKVCKINSSVFIRITNYNTFTDQSNYYTLVASHGTITRVGDTVKFNAPANAVSASIKIA